VQAEADMAEADLVLRWEAPKEAEGREIHRVLAVGGLVQGARAVVEVAEEPEQGLVAGRDREAEALEQGLVADLDRAEAAPEQGLAAGLDQAAERVLEAEPGAAAAVVRADWELGAAEKRRGARPGSG
jgi:hypothetical protein